MSGLYRIVIRVRRFLDLEVTRLRRVPETLALLAAALVVIGIIRATASGADWAGILRSQAVNLVSAAVLAGFAYMLFILRFRRRQLTTYLERQRAAAPVVGDHDPELSTLARTIVDELLDDKPPHATLIIGPADAGQVQLLADVAERLAAKRRVPVTVSLPSANGDVTLPALVRDRFVEGLVGSSGDAQSGRRLYTALVRKRRVVALVRGLDRVGQGEPLAARRTAIANILEASLVEGIPFVAWVHPELAPSISEVAAFRTRPLPRTELVEYTVRQLRDRGVSDVDAIEQVLTRAFHEGEATRDPGLLSLAADLALRRERGGETAMPAVRELFADACAFRRHLAWMAEWALDCRLDDVDDADTPGALALAAIGKESHYHQEAELRADVASAALAPEEQRRFSAGVAVLSHRGVLDISDVDGGKRFRFTHPAWLAFAGALGLRLHPAHWSDLMRPDTSTGTLGALTAALLIFGPDRLTERSFLRLLRSLGPSETEITLEMSLAVIAALQSVPKPLVLEDEELETLARGWKTASDIVKMRFVSEVNLASNPRLIDFLWLRVVPPEFHQNSFRVRRAICTRLGSLGSAAWRRLGREWRTLVDTSFGEDLSSRARRDGDWREGYAVASLAWTLPGVLASIKKDEEYEVFDLLADLWKVVEYRPQEAGERNDPPEIGLEISLAEGFKAAAVEIYARRDGCDERWCEEASSFFNSSVSWISKQALLQTLALVLADGERDQIERLVGRSDDAQREHPFVRETEALVRRALAANRGPVSLTGRDIWLEEVEALDDGGVNLSPECHRLLGLSTLLINLAERPFVAWFHKEAGAEASVVDARDLAFTGYELPRCFLRRGHTATMFATDCDCPFNFCGPAAKRGILKQQRRFSRSFLQRAQATARAKSLIRELPGGRSAERAFAPVWRALDEELAKRDPYLHERR